MNIGKIEDYCSPEFRCKDKLIMVATDITPLEWVKIPLLCFCFWENFEEVLGLCVIASEGNKIHELHFSVPGAFQVTNQKLDEMSAFISGFFSGTTKGIVV